LFLAPVRQNYKKQKEKQETMVTNESGKGKTRGEGSSGGRRGDYIQGTGG